MAKLKKASKPASKKPVVKKPASKKTAGKKPVQKKKKSVSRKAVQGDEAGNGDDLPPDEIEVEASKLDADLLAAEVERTEAKGSAESAEDADDVPVLAPAAAAAADAEADAADADTILPSMEGMSILRETELNDVVQDVKRRSEANGGYITYEELNQILPSNIVDAIQSDKYLKILEALGVQVIRGDRRLCSTVLHPETVLLKNGSFCCFQDGILYYKDGDHLSADGSKLSLKALEGELEKLLSPPKTE